MRDPIRHLAVIPDGNRRWARNRGQAPSEGHRAGIHNVGLIAAAAWQEGVEVFTFWWGSSANLTLRPKREVEVIVGCLNDWLHNEAPAILRHYQAQFEVYGRWRSLCPELASNIAYATAAAGPGPRKMVLLMAYDGREELLDAARKWPKQDATQAKQVNESTLPYSPDDLAQYGKGLWTGSLPDVDMLIRTGGEPHLSAGFMLWRIANAQLSFPETLWPAFGTDELRELMQRYGNVDRRFGR